MKLEFCEQCHGYHEHPALCGINFMKASEVSTPTDQRLKQAAIKWWEARRPLAFGLSQHLDNPAVNCLDGHDSELARAVAATIKASQKKSK